MMLLMFLISGLSGYNAGNTVEISDMDHTSNLDNVDFSDNIDVSSNVDTDNSLGTENSVDIYEADIADQSIDDTDHNRTQSHLDNEIETTQSADAFVSRWDTRNNNTSSSDSNQIQLPLFDGGMYDFTVDWGDGISDTITQYDQPEVTHTYSSEGVYTVVIEGIIKGWRFPVFGEIGEQYKILEISQWGNLSLGNNGYNFLYARNLELTATDAPDLTGTTTLEYTFFGCDNLGDSGNMNSWDVSGVKNMEYMFGRAYTFNQPIDNWNTSSVTTMERMFDNTHIFNQPIGSWNTSSVTNMEAMFLSASSFNQPLGSWNVSAVTNMAGMFSEAESFNQPLGSWNVSSVTDMRGIFYRVNLSMENYDDLLLGWSKLSLQEGVEFTATRGYYSPEAADARQYIIDTFGWTIIDRGLLDDSTAPAIDSPEDITYNASTTGHSIVWSVGDQYPGVYNVTMDGSIYNNATKWSNGSITVDIDGLLVGTYTFTIHVYDEWGNVATDSVLVTVTDPSDSEENTDLDLPVFTAVDIFMIISFTGLLWIGKRRDRI